MFKIKKIGPFRLLLLLSVILTVGTGCSQKVEPLVVYSGKGLIKAMEEVKQTLETQEGIPISIIYAGSNSLLTM